MKESLELLIKEYLGKLCYFLANFTSRNSFSGFQGKTLGGFLSKILMWNLDKFLAWFLLEFLKYPRWIRVEILDISVAISINIRSWIDVQIGTPDRLLLADRGFRIYQKHSWWHCSEDAVEFLKNVPNICCYCWFRRN